MLSGQSRPAMSDRVHAGAHQPFLQDPDAPYGSLVKKVPDRDQIYACVGKRQLLPKREQHTLKHSPVFSRITTVALEVEVDTAAAQLRAEIPKSQQLIRPEQDMNGLRSIGNRFDDIELIR